MNLKNFFCAFLFISLPLLSSCTGEEPANAECDIERAWVHIDNPNSIFYHSADTIAEILASYDNSQIEFPLARHDASVSLIPFFVRITPGANISHIAQVDGKEVEVPFSNGDKIDFSNDQLQRFRVRSEDGNYMREYSFCIRHAEKPKVDTKTLKLGKLVIKGIALAGNSFSSDQRMDIPPYGEIPVKISGSVNEGNISFILDVEMSSDNKAHITCQNGELRGTWNDKELLPKKATATLTTQGDGTATLDLGEFSINTATLIHFLFENAVFDKTNSFHEWNEPNNPDVTWSTGNPGFQLSRSTAEWHEYPSVSVDGGVDGGKCVKLTTSSTGPFGSMVGMPIAAGNLFIGKFDVGNALNNALAATLMGLPFTHKPVYMRGYYKFVPGEVNKDRKGQKLDKPDVCDLYCVVYKNTDAQGNKVQLDGNILDTDKSKNPHVDNIVGKARIASENIVVGNEEWVQFELPVIYTSDIKQEDVMSMQYSVAVVFSSSIGGAYFIGAIGSTLWVDNVTLVCEY